MRAVRSTGRAPLVFGILLLCWVILSEIVVPVLVLPAFQGHGARAMEVIAPLASQGTVVDYWPSYSRTVTAFLALLGGLALLMSWPAFQERVTPRQGGAGAAVVPPLKGRWRPYVVQGLIGVVIGGSVLATLSGVELWPFSPYKMYSQLEVGSASRWLLLGASDQGDVNLGRIPGLTPFDASRLFWAMQHVERRGDRDQALDSIARYVWRRYERMRATGATTGPALGTIRLYRYTWLIDRPRVKPRPDTTELVYQWTVPQ